MPHRNTPYICKTAADLQPGDQILLNGGGLMVVTATMIVADTDNWSELRVRVSSDDYPEGVVASANLQIPVLLHATHQDTQGTSE